MKILQKFEKKFKFYPKIKKTGVKKTLITIPLFLETMQQLIIKPWRRSLGPWCRKKFKNMKKCKKI